MAILVNPKDIEAKSFRIVEKHVAKVKLPRNEKEVLKRVLHATSDLSYIKDIAFHPKAVGNALAAIKKGNNVVVDASMVKAGINKKLVAMFGMKVVCFLYRKDVARQASQLNISRSMVAMRKAGKLMDGGIVAIGNAPTALFELCDMIAEGKAHPAVVIGVPIGFVGAKESKRKLRTMKVPYITNRSRNGGSSVAAACVNALLILSKGGDGRNK